MGAAIVVQGQRYLVTGLWSEEKQGESKNVTIQATIDETSEPRIYGFRPK